MDISARKYGISGAMRYVTRWQAARISSEILAGKSEIDAKPFLSMLALDTAADAIIGRN